MSNTTNLPRRVRCGLLLLLAITTQAVFETPAAAAPDSDGLAHEARPASWKTDAALTDVTFADRLHGWAVGSHGVLLRTDNGGETWTEAQLAAPVYRAPEMSLKEKLQGIQAKQRIGVDKTASAANFSCRFESVCFTDSQNGWAAGGYDLPYMNYSRAVIARTLDGGKSWHPLPHLMLGRIQRIDMSGLSGWSVGPRDPASKSALYFTSDAGNIWNSQKSRQMPDLIDAATAGNRFVGIDVNGQPLHFDTRTFEYSAFIGVKDAVRLSDLSMQDSQRGYAVGANGVILQTDNGALSWKKASDHQPLKQFDFRCLDCRSEKVWFAGDPGNVIFSLDPHTGELSSRVLPAAGAINAIHFFDDDNGWAVGDFGRIYATRDGGQNWQLQRSASLGHSHVGAMVVCEDATELPLELIAKQAGENGKLIGVIALGTANSDAIRLAAERLGAIVVSTIDAESEADYQRRIVRTIRLWKPTLLIGANESLSAAMQLAGDSAAFPEQANAGLKPWQTRYLMVADPQGPIQYETRVFLPRMGMQLQDLSLPSRMICDLPIQGNRESRFFAWQASQGTQSRLKPMDRSPFSLASFAKREPTSIPLGSLSSVARVGHKNEQLNGLLRQNIDSAADWETCKQQIGQLGLPLRATPGGDYLAAVWLTELADRYVATGHHERAALALEELVRSYPQHCLAPVASTTLARYYASAEFRQLAVAAWQRRGGSFKRAQRIPRSGNVQVAVEQKTLGNGRKEFRWSKVDLAAALEEAAELPLKIDIAEELKDFDPATVDLSLDVEPEPQTAPATTAPSSEPAMTQADRDAFLRTRLRFAANHFSRLGARDPSLVKRADMLYLQAHIVKQLSGFEPAKPYFENVAKADARSPYATAARSILGEGPSSDSTQVMVATERAKLDGLPNDPQWQDAMSRQQMVSVVGDNGTGTTGLGDIAMVTRDEAYLYLYVRCYKSDRFRYREGQQAMRQRDADLSRQDRIQFAFDVDHDLSSSWDVQIDWRGKVHESCGADASWNPRMFVARHVDDRVWAIECAILLEDLQGFGASDRWRWTVERTEEAETDAGFWPTRNVDFGRVLSFP